MPKPSVHEPKLLPYQQGDLENLCGLYALINASRLAEALRFVPKVLKTSELCLVAVQNDHDGGWAIKYVPEALKTPALCLAAVKKNGYALRFVPKALKNEMRGRMEKSHV